MKELIALCICLPLLLTLIPQYGLQVRNDRNMSRAETIVNAAKEEAKQQGYFTVDMKERMVSSLEGLGYTKGEIEVDLTTTPKYRTSEFDERELIQYRVGIPIKKKIAANRFFGISDEDNEGVYYIEGAAASERLPEGSDD